MYIIYKILHVYYNVVHVGSARTVAKKRFYCPKKTTSNALEIELMVGGEETSDAHPVSVLADPTDPTKHYFHFARNTAVSSSCY